MFCGSKNIDEEDGVVFCQSCGELLTDDDIF
jgi:hypothetical protein